ncbi:MAG: transcriptional repressor LexA [Tissierellia bacterium]|nr:transcriptional repressor LexA [Tissierellia bacterium]
MYSDLNEKQLKVLNFIKYNIAENGYPPTVREIAASVGIKSTSTVYKYIQNLEEKKYIRKSSSKNRAIEVIEYSTDYEMPTKKTIDIPIIGTVTAGQPILAIENIEDTFPIPIEHSFGANLFMLTVQGESMIEAGILDGDLIVVRQQNNAENGDIVVALIDDSATVKRYFKKDDHIMLKPENSSMEPIKTKNAVILGKVISLYRNF